MCAWVCPFFSKKTLLWCRLQQYRLFTFLYHSFYFFGIWLSVQICVFLLLWFYFSFYPLYSNRSFSACSFHCVKIYVTRGCVGFLYSISMSRCKVLCRVYCDREIIYLLRIGAMCARWSCSNNSSSSNGKRAEHGKMNIHSLLVTLEIEMIEARTRIFSW